MKSLLLICIIFCIASSLAEKKKIVCYYGSKAATRPGYGRFEVGNIDPAICTHIIYSFFGVTAEGEITYLDPYLDLPDNLGKNFIGKFIKLKSKNPDLKLLASVGNVNSSIFSQLASGESSRSIFANNAASFLIKHDFDGLDLYWEYPNQRDGVQADKENFVSLLAALKETLAPLQKSLSIAVGSTEKSASTSYDIPRVADNVDFINLMSYDLHGSWNSFTGIHGALYPHPRDVTDEVLRELNVDAAVSYWLKQGCPKEKLIVGIPTYGRTFTLGNENENGIGASAIGAGNVGTFVLEAGFLGFNEICFKQSEWTRHWEQQQQVPYAVKGNQWVGYDDIESVTIKLNYILERDLGGAMYMSLETDDFGDNCNYGKFPLVTLAKTIFNNEVTTVASASTSSQATSSKRTPPTAGPLTVATKTMTSTTLKSTSNAPTTPKQTTTDKSTSITSTTVKQTTITTVKSTGVASTTTKHTTTKSTTKAVASTTKATTSNPSGSFTCPSTGLYRDPENCSKFYNCSLGVPFHFDCPANLFFNELVGVCDWPRNVVCLASS